MDKQLRKEAILRKYGTWEAYELKRKEKTRETALKKCKTEEEKQTKLKKFEKEDLWKASVVKENIGKEIICTRCGDVFTANTNQQLYCRKCVLAISRIERSGSLEQYYIDSKVKEKKTLLERYGDKNYNNRKQAKETCIQHFGVEHQFMSSEIIAKSRQTKLKKYGNENYNNTQKSQETCLERYGETTTLHLPEMLERIKKIKIEKYGDENYRNIEKFTLTCWEHFGGPAPFSSPKIRKKYVRTLLKNYGVLVPLQSPIIRDRYRKTNLEKYGVDNYQKIEEAKKNNSKRMRDFPPMNNPESVKKMIATTLNRYGTFSTRVIHYYDNNYFDSSWELAYYIYLQTKKVFFLYKPAPIPYTTKNERKHLYFPDFFVNGSYIEIKGNHLINKDGILIDYSGTPLFEKTKCLSDNNVNILTGKDITPILKYVANTFGKNFIYEHRVSVTHKQDNIND